MASLVGKLKVSLGLDGAAFSKGLKDQRNGMQKFGAGMAKIGAGISVASTGIALAVKRQLNFADDMSKSAQKFGVPIERLTAYNHAAEMSGVSIESLGTGLRRLSQNMDEATKGNKTAVAMFKDLGIEVKDAAGNMRPTEAVLADVSDVLAGMPDGAAKTALAMKLLGKSGADMIPMLNGGSAALNAMVEEARSYGLVIDAKTGKAAENFNDNLSRLSKTVSGIAIQVMANLAPALERISDMAVKATMVFRDLSPGVQTAISAVAAFTVVLGPLAVGLGLTIMAVGAAAGAFSFLLGPVGLALGAIVAVAAAAAYLIQKWDQIRNFFPNLWEDVRASTESKWQTIDSYMIFKTSGPVSKSWEFMRNGWSMNLQLMKMVAESAFSVISAAMTNPIGTIQSAWSGLGDGLSEAVRVAKEGMILQWDMIVAEVQTWPPHFVQLGRDLVQGLADGIKAGIMVPVEAIRGVAQSVIDKYREITITQSPSRVFREFGQYISEGLGLGISDGADMATGSMASLADTIVGKGQSLASGLSQFGQQFEGIFVGLVTRTMSLKDAIKQVAASLAQMFAKSAFQSLFSGGGVLGGIGQIFGFANGTQNAPGGLAWVGERGPELVNLPRGSQVFDNQRSVSMMRGASGGGAVRVIGGDLMLTDGGQIMTRVQVVADNKVKAGLQQVPQIMANYNKRNA